MDIKQTVHTIAIHKVNKSQCTGEQEVEDLLGDLNDGGEVNFDDISDDILNGEDVTELQKDVAALEDGEVVDGTDGGGAQPEAMDITLGAEGAAAEPSSEGKARTQAKSSKQNHSTFWDLCDNRLQAEIYGLQKAMGCQGGVCGICSAKVGKNGAYAHYGSHGFAWYCSCGFTVLGRGGCRSHASGQAPQTIVIHEVSPENKESLESKLGKSILEFPKLREGKMTVAEAAQKERVWLNFATFEGEMTD